MSWNIVELSKKKMPRGNKRSKEVQEVIKEKVFKAIIGSTADHVAMKQIGLGKATYFRYKKLIAQDIKKNYTSKPELIISEYIARTKERSERAKGFSKNATDVSREQGIDDSLTKRLQEVGALERAPELIKQEVTFVSYKEPEFIRLEKERKLKEKKDEK